MNYLDEAYLKELGIADLSEEVKKPLAEGLEEQIQGRIGLRFTEMLSDELLDEFSMFTDGTVDDVKVWLGKVMPFYEKSPEYLEAKAAATAVSEDDFVRNYGVAKWMEMNVPNYTEIVREVLESVKSEVLEQKQKILG